VLRRLLTSRWVKLAFLAVALGFCAYGLYSQRTEVAKALGHFAWDTLLGSFAAGLAALACMMQAWCALLADLGSRLPPPAAIRVYFISALGKYLPGAVWAVAAQVELGRDHHVPRQRSASASVVAMLITLAAGLLTASVALPLSSAHAVHTYWWALILLVPALAGLYPPLTGYLLDRALRLTRRAPLERRMSAAGMSRAVGWSLLGWAFFGVHAWLLVVGVTGRGVDVLPVAAGAYALAWAVGFIAIPIPGGVGLREAVFVVALAPVMARPSAIVVAVMSRLVLTVADLAWAAAAGALGRRARPGGTGTDPAPADSVSPDAVSR
jgi:uncharacterized membrane protein YbhN (UPF0104 family)